MYTPSIKQQLIKKEAILELFKETPATGLLTPNWEAAIQGKVGNSSMVRIPIKNWDKLKDLMLPSIELELKKTLTNKQMGIKNQSLNPENTTNINGSNYFEKHPPELYITKDPSSGKLKAYLLNFVPKDQNFEFGENGVWTGTLYEWNLKGDTVLAQEIVKNKLQDRYGLRSPVITKTESKVNATGKILSLNDKKTSSFFGWFADLVGDVIGWIAHTLGFSTYNYYGGGWRIDWGPSLAPAEGGDSGYGGYIGGYGGGGGNVSYPSGGQSDAGSIVIPASTLYLISVLQITDPVQMDFLTENVFISDQLATYLQTNNESTASKEFANWAIEYLTDFPDADVIELISNNNMPISTINLPNLDVSQLSNYPAFKNLVENLPSFLNSYPNILKALEYTTGFSPKKIKELMQPGKGPKVVVINNLKDNKGNDIVGHYDKNTKTIQIDNGYVDDLSAANTPVKYQAMGLMLIVATLHEFAHFGTNENSLIPVIKNRLKDPDYEPGWDFEGIIQPQSGPGYLQPSTAKEWLKYYKIKPRI